MVGGQSHRANLVLTGARMRAGAGHKRCIHHNRSSFARALPPPAVCCAPSRVFVVPPSYLLRPHPLHATIMPPLEQGSPPSRARRTTKGSRALEMPDRKLLCCVLSFLLGPAGQPLARRCAAHPGLAAAGRRRSGPRLAALPAGWPPAPGPAPKRDACMPRASDAAWPPLQGPGQGPQPGPSLHAVHARPTPWPRTAPRWKRARRGAPAPAHAHFSQARIPRRLPERVQHPP